MDFPQRWQDCKPFLDCLLRRGYITLDDEGNYKTLMSDGIYLYMYELFQDGYALD